MILGFKITTLAKHDKKKCVSHNHIISLAYVEKLKFHKALQKQISYIYVPG